MTISVGKKPIQLWHQKLNPTLFLWYLQYDSRHDGEKSWEEMVVRATTREDALEVSGMDIYDPEKVYSNIVGVVPAGEEEKGIVCFGIHDHESSWEFIKKEIRYDATKRVLETDELVDDEPPGDSLPGETTTLEPEDL